MSHETFEMCWRRYFWGSLGLAVVLLIAAKAFE